MPRNSKKFAKILSVDPVSYALDSSFSLPKDWKANPLNTSVAVIAAEMIT